jgi:hypothetical protein
MKYKPEDFTVTRGWSSNDAVLSAEEAAEQANAKLKEWLKYVLSSFNDPKFDVFSVPAIEIKPPSDIQMLEVNSTNLSHIGYDETSKTLKVRFRENGAEYKYLDVSKNAYDRLMNAKSIGSFFSIYVKNQYKYEKLN